MKIILGVPDAFSEQGQKSNQEDRYMPPRSEMGTSRCFVLCDGMGGHENGEVAAEIVSTALYGFMTNSAPKSGEDIMTDERFSKALADTNVELDKMPVTEGKRPGTTMTCLYFAENGVFAAHIGDSRIYQLRPGHGVIFKSRDHSLVNDLLRAGELTEEEAKTFPRKNVITRAMQPGLDRPYRADTKLITDVRPGDYFFLCCDGILEQLDDDRLVAIVEDSTLSDKGKLDSIYDVCFGRTRDNFTCILIPVKGVEGEIPAQPVKDQNDAVTAVVDVERPQDNASAKSSVKTKPASKSSGNDKKWIYWAFGAIVLAAVVVLLIVFTTSKEETPEKTAPNGKPHVSQQDKKQTVQEENQVTEEDLLYGNDPEAAANSKNEESKNDEGDLTIPDEVTPDSKDTPDSKPQETKTQENKNETPINTPEELGKVLRNEVKPQTGPPSQPSTREQKSQKGSKK